MTELFEIEERDDHRVARRADGLLATFNRAGLLTSADVHAATRICALADEVDPEVALAVAALVRAARHGSVCVDLDALVTSEGAADLPWPAVDSWRERIAASVLAASGVLRREGGLLYLDRFWREEGQVRDDLWARVAAPAPQVDEEALAETADRLFPAGYDEQRTAALAAARQWTTVLTGGPGTGKTTTVAGLLALLAAQSERPLRVALTAPTGKASARLQQAVEEAQADERFSDADRARLSGLSSSTLHRLLGWTPGSRNRFRHHRRNKLPHDVVVVDETSMVSLTMMARLLEAVRPDARLVLVGDADQLASVEAGAVLADLVQGLAGRAPGAVTGLRTTHRFGESIGALAEALRQGDADRVVELLTDDDDRVQLVDPVVGADALRARLLDHALATRAAALAGDADAALAAMDAHRLLCAHRDGPFGVAHWNRLTERLLAEHDPAVWQEWYAGRPLLVTSNDYGLGLYNGDTGVVVREDDKLRGVIAGVRSHLWLATARLGAVETLHAMTIHKSQGSQVAEVTLLLPPPDSPLLTRELFYTAVTRAKERVHVVGTAESVVAAVERRAQRATGLAQRLAAD
ncbi:exodeoxyribonuclease V subunit alpha [Nocardioides humilatus]|uniref:RecBCD enzyme subunit RecD n=1 Tax=Nocardioides humilatus TaxID=2607660 RepID=A0A5B1LM60_9ACTN|nr:exodeoxyribonuclease V subunit alpha [Nocardioides humilatus]KAA1421771.1 exodeoxyribonuclease V subunit alpha [Nocardioides humilatus]